MTEIPGPEQASPSAEQAMIDHMSGLISGGLDVRRVKPILLDDGRQVRTVSAGPLKPEIDEVTDVDGTKNYVLTSYFAQQSDRGTYSWDWRVGGNAVTHTSDMELAGKKAESHSDLATITRAGQAAGQALGSVPMTIPAQTLYDRASVRERFAYQETPNVAERRKEVEAAIGTSLDSAFKANKDHVKKLREGGRRLRLYNAEDNKVKGVTTVVEVIDPFDKARTFTLEYTPYDGSTPLNHFYYEEEAGAPPKLSRLKPDDMQSTSLQVPTFEVDDDFSIATWGRVWPELLSNGLPKKPSFFRRIGGSALKKS